MLTGSPLFQSIDIMIETLVFYLFSTILIVSAVMVVTARNPVHSVLFLILGFFNSAGLFILLGAEFIAMIMVIVYVGAVAVLFLFVVMMLDINFANLRKGALKYIPVGITIGVILLAELFITYLSWPDIYSGVLANTERPIPAPDDVNNTEALGRILYTETVLAFQVAGLILLVAMVGAIVLTLRTRLGVRRQKVERQTAMKPEEAMEIRKVSQDTDV